MNERVKELYEQAQDWADNQNFFASEYYDYMMAKFAELIVRECADVAFLEANSRKVQRSVLQHFGVEE